MKKALISLLIIAITVLGDLRIAVAIDTGPEDSVVICSNQDKRRILTLDYLFAGAYVPCRVIYEKTTEMPDHSEILWSAENKAGYCEQKMNDFIHHKLEDKWGWQCSEQKPSIPEHEHQAQTWYVILGSFLQTQRGLNAALMLRNQFRANNILNQDYFIVGESYFYTGFTKGLYIVMTGPFNQIDAQNWAELGVVLKIVPDAYVQQATVRGSGTNSAKEWYVILGLYPQTHNGYQLANKRSKRLRRNDNNVIVTDSEFCDGLTGGLIVVMMGAFDNKQQALTKEKAVKHFVREAYIMPMTCRGNN